MSRSLLAIAVLLLAACQPAVRAQAAADAAPAPPWAGSRQMVVVTTPGWDAPAGEMRTFERAPGGRWRAVGAVRAVVIGRTGAAWGIGLHETPAGDPGPLKHEGDGRSPAGVFTIGEAFGYAPTAATGLHYAAMDAGDYCVDVDGSPLYNRIVDSAEVGADAVKGATETMRLDLHAHGDQRYRLGFVIEHNPNGVRGGGSCIFGHLWKSPDSTTSGCTAMAPATMDALQRWLDADRNPVFVLLPVAEYARLQAAWQLPALADDTSVPAAGAAAEPHA